MTAEQVRLDEARRQKAAWKNGALPEGAAMGDRARGLQRFWRCMEYFSHDHACSRAYRWGEDGLAGGFRRAPTALFLAGALERQGRDPQGAAVQADTTAAASGC